MPTMVVGIFRDEQQGNTVLEQMKDMHRDKTDQVQAATVLHKDAEGTLHYEDAGPTLNKGAMYGGALGFAVGVLTGGAGIVLGVLGAAAGGMLGKHDYDKHFTPERLTFLNSVAGAMPPSSSGIMLLTEDVVVSTFVQSLAAFGAETTTSDMSDEELLQLHQFSERINADAQKQ